VETVNQVIRISQASGITQARVKLHPEELGSIDIHLRSTPDGLVAKVLADASQAAAVLRDGGDDLRRMLASQGINLSHFDVGTTAQDGGQSGFQAGGEGNRRGGSSAGSHTPDQDIPAETTEENAISLPNGVLVDVLA
jgi:flagellar hook-length control protein FliK